MNSLDSLDEEILEVERLLGLSTRQLVRTRLVLLLSDLQQVSGLSTYTEDGVRKVCLCATLMGSQFDSLNGL